MNGSSTPESEVGMAKLPSGQYDFLVAFSAQYFRLRKVEQVLANWGKNFLPTDSGGTILFAVIGDSALVERDLARLTEADWQVMQVVIELPRRARIDPAVGGRLPLVWRAGSLWVNSDSVAVVADGQMIGL